MGEQAWEPQAAAIFNVIVDRMIVAAGQLEGGKQRIGLGARWVQKALTNLEILKIALFGDFVAAPGAGFRFASSVQAFFIGDFDAGLLRFTIHAASLVSNHLAKGGEGFPLNLNLWVPKF